MTRALYLHIGTEKTGTTFLQEVLFRNRELLQSEGFHFLQCAGETNNRAIPAICMDDEKVDEFTKRLGLLNAERRQRYRKGLRRRLAEELTGLPDDIHSLIISSEHFHSSTRSREEIERVRQMLEPYFSSVRVICYLREQSAVCRSLYSTSIKGGNKISGSFNSQMEKCNPQNSYYNYYDMVSNWAAVFGKENLVLRLFDKDEFVGGDLVGDFFSLLRPGLAEKLDRDVELANESLSHVGQLIGLAINRSFPKYTREKRDNVVRARAFRKLYSVFKGKGRAISVEDYTRIYDSFEASNRQLNREYLGRDENLFPVEQVGETGARELDDSLADDLAEVISEISRSVTGLQEEQAFLLRDAARKLHKKDIRMAYYLMELAVMIRPQGKMINRLLEEYRLQLMREEERKARRSIFGRMVDKVRGLGAG